MVLNMCAEVAFSPTNFTLNFSCDPNVTSGSHKTKFEIACQLYIISILCVIGLFGNVMAVIVLRNDKLRREALFLLQVLAIVDGIYVFLAVWKYPVEYMTDVSTYNERLMYIFPLLKTFQTITIWMMVLVTTDRYIYVCWPLHAQRFFTHRSRRVMAAVVVCGGILFNIPLFFENCIMKVYNPCTNTSASFMIYSETFNKGLYFDIYKYALHAILLYILPLLTLCIMNFRLIQAIQHSRRYPRSDYPQERDYSDSNATLVLVIIVAAFIVCQTPELISKIIIIVIRYHKDKNHLYQELQPFSQQTLNVISEVMIVLNSSINFYIYVAFGRRFRYIMKETFKYLAYSNSTMITRESVPLQQQHQQVNNIIHFIRQ